MRVAATPKTVSQLRKLGYHVFVESGAGLGASFNDDAYREVGGVIVGNAWNRDVVLTIGSPSDTQLLEMRRGATLISILRPQQDPSLTRRIAAQDISASAWTWCHQSRVRRPSMPSARWRASPATGPSWRPPTPSGGNSQARPPLRARNRPQPSS